MIPQSLTLYVNPLGKPRASGDDPPPVSVLILEGA